MFKNIRTHYKNIWKLAKNIWIFIKKYLKSIKNSFQHLILVADGGQDGFAEQGVGEEAAGEGGGHGGEPGGQGVAPAAAQAPVSPDCQGRQEVVAQVEQGRHLS